MSTASGGPADLVFLNGPVYTMDAARSWARAVAVRDGRIVATGFDKEVRELIGPATDVVELGDGMLLPGFQDAHVHPLAGGLERLRCDLTGTTTVAGYKETIAAYLQNHPDVEWVLGGGWSMASFPGGTPTRADLDAVVPDRPAFLFNRDHHGAWVNSTALALAGLDAATPDPADGRIERDERGEPSGTLHEGAMDLVERLAPMPSDHLLAGGLLEGQRYLHSLGITSWQDAIVGREFGGRDTFPIYVDADRSGRLTARVAGALWFERGGDETQIEEFIARRAQSGDRRFKATTVKFMQDGVCENFTAGMLEPYLDESGNPTGNRGLSFFEPEALQKYVTLVDRAGFQAHFHAIGDRAVRESLDAVEAAIRSNGHGPNRHHISHIQVIHPDDIPRFRSLNVAANAQPLWAYMEDQMRDLTIPFLGPERSDRQYPFGSLLKAGAMVAFGSDWPVSSPNPLWGIHVAVNRTDPEDGSEPFLPGQALDLHSAIAAYTMGAAWVNLQEESTGSIEPGKLADLVVLDRNLFAHPADEIAKTNVEMTVVGGEVVFRRGDS